MGSVGERPDRALRHARGWVWRNLRGAVLAMGPDEQALRFEGAAALVWRAIDGTRDRAAVAAAAQAAAGEDVGAPGDVTIDGQVAAALEQLEALGAVEVVDRIASAQR
ncbi:MAG: PqqD family peptide modification chaperone [Acidimicrobiales bacterium]